MAARKGPSVGSGGQGKRKLAGRGPTPKAEERSKHPAAKRAAAASRRGTGRSEPPSGRRGPAQGGPAQGGPAQGGPARRGPSQRVQARDRDAGELVAGRNSVAEALRARVPATMLLVAAGIDADERVTEALAIARKRGLEVREVPRQELDRMLERGVQHQGLVLAVPAYDYAHPDDLLAAATAGPAPALIVALDGVTDPRNLGSVIRSTAAFGGHGVLVPERRSAGVTAATWKTSSGAAARIPVARATNLVRTLTAYQQAGLFVVGLAADGDLPLDDLGAADGPLVLVAGSEGKGLGRLVGETCDLRVSIPMAGPVESLNAGVAAAVALAEVARRRRVGAAAGALSARPSVD